MRDKARDGLLGKPGPEALDVCRRWDQLHHTTAMRLGAELGIDVREVIPKAQRDDPSLRFRSLASELCDGSLLQGRLRVPGAVGDITVTATCPGVLRLTARDGFEPSSKRLPACSGGSSCTDRRRRTYGGIPPGSTWTGFFPIPPAPTTTYRI